MIKIVPEIVIRQRLNTHLAARGECLRRHRVPPRSSELIDGYYIAILDTDRVVSRDIRLGDLARQEGVIRLGESIVVE